MGHLQQDATGSLAMHQDPRVLDRVYPQAISAGQPGPSGVQRLLLTAPDSGRTHVALITNGAAVPEAMRAAAQRELATWATANLP